MLNKLMLERCELLRILVEQNKDQKKAMRLKNDHWQQKDSAGCCHQKSIKCVFFPFLGAVAIKLRE